MTQEPNTEDKEKPTTTATVSKLLIDRPSDFRFHAAYLIYSAAWEKNTSNEVRTKLNEKIEALSKDQIDYETFYHEVNQYRSEFNPEHFIGRSGRKTYIETQRKSDWRKREERDRRNARHGR